MPNTGKNDFSSPVIIYSALSYPNWISQTCCPIQVFRIGSFNKVDGYI